MWQRSIPLYRSPVSLGGLLFVLVSGVVLGQTPEEKAQKDLLEFEQKILAMPREKIDERGPLVVQYFSGLKEPSAKVMAIGMIDERYRNMQVVPPKVESAVLGKFLKDPDLAVRTRAARALAYIGKGGEHFEELKKLLTEPGVEVKKTVLAAMGRSHEPRFLPLMKPYLKHADAKLRWAAAEGMSLFPPDLVRADLIPLLNDPAVEVRANTARDIARIGGKAVLNDVAKLVYDDDAGVRLTAIAALADQKDIRWAKFVAHLLVDEDPLVRGQAALALGRLKALDFAGNVVALTKDKDFYVRRMAARAVQEYGDISFAPKLVALLQDMDDLVRQQAIQALWNLNAKKTANDIAARLTDPASNVRREAVLALMKMNSSGHAPQIAQMLDDQDAKVRLYAITALGIFRADPFLPRLKLLCDDDDVAIRDAARYAVSRIEQK